MTAGTEGRASSQAGRLVLDERDLGPLVLVAEDSEISCEVVKALLSNRERCMRAGMDDYLAKPFDRVQLEAAVGRWLRHGAEV